MIIKKRYINRLICEVGESMGNENGVLAGKTSKDLDLLQRHINMLQIVAENEPIGIIKLAEMLELPHHKVRYSLRLLEKDGLIKASSAGARTTKKVAPFLEEMVGNLAAMGEAVKQVQRAAERLRKTIGTR
jgi:predicted transcriptional regulator